MTQKSVSLILPAYNEASSIQNSLETSCSYFIEKGLKYEIIVSADGNDGTRKIASEFSNKNPHILVIGNQERRGKGHGIRQAVSLATGDIIGFADADNKTPITEFDKFLPFLLDGSDVVIGSRARPESIIERRQPKYRQIGSKAFGMFMHLTVGLWDIPDTQCGFKFFQNKAAKNLFRLQKIDGYMYDVEILYLAERLGYSIEQIPIRWHDDGDSRLNLVVGNIRNLIDILRIRLENYE